MAPYITTTSAAEAATDAIIALRYRTREVRSIQERTAAMAWSPATQPV